MRGYNPGLPVDPSAWAQNTMRLPLSSCDPSWWVRFSQDHGPHRLTSRGDERDGGGPSGLVLYASSWWARSWPWFLAGAGYKS